MSERARVVELHVRNLRTHQDVSLELGGLTVLIGDNGSGKSSLIEAFELLRRASEPSFASDVGRIHGGVGALTRLGADAPLSMHAVLQSNGTWGYTLALTGTNGHVTVASEDLVALDPRSRAADVRFERRGIHLRYLDASRGEFVEMELPDDRLALTAFGLRPPNAGVTEVLRALRAIEVHVPFEVTPAWVARSARRETALREEGRLEPADHLERLGVNLASAWHALKNDFDAAHWEETLGIARLGLGDDLDGINTRVSAGGAAVALWLKHRGFDRQLPASSLSDGSLAFLALVAMIRLDAGRSLLALDEPELHLHPHLLLRALDLFESVALDHPVVLATHSDRLLDGLTDPVNSVVLCELDGHRATHLIRPDAPTLARWLERYRGLGDLRAAGYERLVMTRGERPR
jgi:predicted ATPase